MKFLQTYFLAAILVWSGTSCTQQIVERPVAPEVLLPQEQMAAMLAEMHVADAMQTELVQVQDSAVSNTKTLYQHIYKKYGVNETVFKANFDYYRKMPVEMDSIYARVVTVLGTLESAYQRK